MTTTEIKELFELTAQRVAQIKTESARDIAQIRKEAEGIRKKNDEETAPVKWVII